MGRKFEELMRNYGKIKQFPIDDDLMPLSDQQSSTKDNEEANQAPPKGFRDILMDPPPGVLFPIPFSTDDEDDE